MILGLSNRYDPNDQTDQVALYWMNMSKGETPPLTVRVLGKDRDVRLDIAGGSQIPRARRARRRAAERILVELRASWRGVKKLLLAYDGSSLSADFLDTVLSFLDPADRGHPDRRLRARRPGRRRRVGGGRGRPPRASSGPASSAATSSSVVVRGEPGPADRPGRPGRPLRRHLHEPPRRVPRAATRWSWRPTPATSCSTPPAASSSGFAPKSIPQAKDSRPDEVAAPAGH